MITNEDKLLYIEFKQHQLHNALIKACGSNVFELVTYLL